MNSTGWMVTSTRGTRHRLLWKGGLPDAPIWLAEHGWHPDLYDRADEAARYGRASTDPLTGTFVTAIRTQP